MSRPRVLLAITVYNGWAFVPQALKSAMEIDGTLAEVDVLVLDDTSPEPGFSPKLASLCRELGVKYYRSPRNLGIVRNVNLGLLAAVEHGYDYVIISNSDVIYSRQVVGFLLEAARADPRIGSVTAWSNNVSIYSIPNTDPDAFLASQDFVNWLAASLAGNYRGAAIDVPAGISFCVMIPTQVLRVVGLMDPVFGRGYCEETDWSLRSLAMGYRIALAPAAFVYHQGRGSTLAAGIVTGGHTTVPENEAIIDYRHPLFRSQVDAFVNGGILDRLHKDSIERIITDGATQYGYEIRVGDLDTHQPTDKVQVSWKGGPERPIIRAAFRGFECNVLMYGDSPYAAVESFFKKAPSLVSASGNTPSWFSPSALGRPMYPSRV